MGSRFRALRGARDREGSHLVSSSGVGEPLFSPKTGAGGSSLCFCLCYTLELDSDTMCWVILVKSLVGSQKWVQSSGARECALAPRVTRRRSTWSVHISSDSWKAGKTSMPPARIRPLTSALRSVAQEGSCTSLQLALQLWPVHPVGLYCPVGVLKCCAVVSRHNASTPMRSISRIGSTAVLA